jgi:hypothetical protein
MTTPRVIRRGEVSIAGKFYKLTRPIQSTLASLYPAPVRIGAIGIDSQQRLSVIRWDNTRGGIGKKEHQDAVDVERIFFGTSHLRVNGHRTLPDRQTTTAASGVTGTFTIGAMGEISDKIHVAFGTSIRSYTPDTWGSNIQTISAPATDAITCRLGGTNYLIFTNDADYYYTSNGTSYATATDNIKYFACWDDRLWGIDSTGQLRWAFDPTGTWTDDAQLPLPDDYVQDLFVGRDANNNHILYASTKVGLFAHDVGNNKFVQTEMDMPFHDKFGAGVDRFRDATYIPAGLGIYKYSVGGSAAVITIVGPDRDHGLPADRRGTIVRLLKTHNDLLALIDDTAVLASSTDTFVSSGMASHSTSVMGVATGRSMVLAWNEIGWQVLWESGENEQSMDYALVSNEYGEYRLWIAQNQLVHFIKLPIDVVNPEEITDRVYADSSQDDFPWFTDGQAEVDKTAVRLIVEVEGASSTETVAPSIGLDYDDATFTALSTITTNGFHVYTFPNTVAGVETGATGTPFRAIRFRNDLANGSDNLKSPDVRSMTLEFRKKVKAKFAWSLELDLQKSMEGIGPKQQRVNINAAVASIPFVPFTFRDDEGNERNFHVDLTNFTGLEESGHDETGIIRLVAAAL